MLLLMLLYIISAGIFGVIVIFFQIKVSRQIMQLNKGMQEEALQTENTYERLVRKVKSNQKDMSVYIEESTKK